jgi:hypothetical protein
VDLPENGRTIRLPGRVLLGASLKHAPAAITAAAEPKELTMIRSNSRFALSRRKMLIGAGTATVGIGTAAVAGFAAARENGSDSEDAIVVQVLDAREGRLAIFVGDRLVEVKDKGLASDLVKASKKKK